MAPNVHTPSTRLADMLAAQPKDVVATVCAPPHEADLICADVVEVAEVLGIDFVTAPFSIEDLHLALEVELEIGHECAPSMVDALDEDLIELGMVAVANLQERSDYYMRLTRASAPGDPPLPRHEHADVGAD